MCEHETQILTIIERQEQATIIDRQAWLVCACCSEYLTQILYTPALGWLGKVAA